MRKTNNAKAKPEEQKQELAKLGMKKKLVVRVSIPEELYNNLMVDADRQGISLSPLITILLNQIYDAKENILTLQKMLNLSEKQIEQQKNAEKYGIKHDGTIAEDFR